jgi:hypothetical protein
MTAIEFYDSITINGKKAGGLKISESEYNEIKAIQDELDKVEKERKLEEFKSQKTVIHNTSYGFAGLEYGKYNNKIQNAVFRKLEDKTTMEDYGDYSITDKVEITGAELIEMLEEEKRIQEQKQKEIKEKEENKINEIFAKAKETGEKQKISSWFEPCNDHNEDCDLDNITEYAMPDGTRKTIRSHTY